MSRLSITPLVVAALALGLQAHAQTPTPATQTAPIPTAPAAIGPAKIGWIDLVQAVVTCEDGKRELGEVQKFVESKNSQLEAMRKEAETLQKQLEVQGAKLTDEARGDLEEQIESKNTLLQRFQQDTQKEIDARRTRAQNLVARKMIGVIEQISKEKGLSAILILNPQRDAWVDSSLIVTEEVVKAYNAKYPAAAPAPATKKP